MSLPAVKKWFDEFQHLMGQMPQVQLPSGGRVQLVLRGDEPRISIRRGTACLALSVEDAIVLSHWLCALNEKGGKK